MHLAEPQRKCYFYQLINDKTALMSKADVEIKNIAEISKGLHLCKPLFIGGPSRT